MERIPFGDAISDPKLLKNHFDTLSAPQKVVLKAFNGLPLTEEELKYWAILQGACAYDHLGYVTSWTPIAYRPKKYHTLVAILGRRSGKTDRITATQLAYEAVLGGHERFVEPGQDFKILFIAQDKPTAGSHLNFVYSALRTSALLFKKVKKFNADELILSSGLKIEPAAANITASRGLAVPGWVADESGFWYTDPKAANPDFEVERAVEYAMGQFPDAFKIITSTPWTKEGMLWKYHLAGTEGSKLPPDERDEHEGVLVIHASEAAMENPRLAGERGHKRRVRLQKRDPEAFVRESLAQFVDSISGFIKPEVLLKCIDKKILERGPDKSGQTVPIYVASMDPAFRHDKFAFTIMHHDLKQGIVQDFFQEWTPELGVPLNPSVVLAEIKLKLDEFGLSHIYSDQYQLESLQQLALGMNFSIIGIDFTAASKAKIYGSLASLVNQSRLRLLDHKTIYDQLVALEKRRTPMGVVQISAPPGKYDDAAAAVALGAHQCVWLLPTAASAPAKAKSHVEEGLEAIKRKRALEEDEED